MWVWSLLSKASQLPSASSCGGQGVGGESRSGQGTESQARVLFIIFEDPTADLY